MIVELNKYDNTLIFKNKSIARDKIIYKSVDLTDFMNIEYSNSHEQVLDKQNVLLIPIQNLGMFISCLTLIDEVFELTFTEQAIEKPYDKGDLISKGYKYISAHSCIISQEYVEVSYTFGIINMFDYIEGEKLVAIISQEHAKIEIKPETNAKIQDVKKLLTKDQSVFVTKQTDGIVFHSQKELKSSEWTVQAPFSGMNVLENKEMIPETFILSSNSIPSFQGELNIMHNAFFTNENNKSISVYAYAF